MIRKTAFITGASEGLGRTFVKQLALLGYDTTSVARNEARLKELMQELYEDDNVKGNHEYLVADLGTEEGVYDCVHRLRSDPYDLLINNAGFSCFGNFDESPLENEHKIMNVNCHSMMTLAHTFLQHAESGDAMINLSSITTYLPTPIQPTYVATKCFVASFSESLWFQQREKGVYVQGLCPGVTKTQFIERASDIDDSKKKILDMVSQTPEQVVATSLRELERRKKPIVIPGMMNRVMAAVIKALPRKPVILAVGHLGKLA